MSATLRRLRKIGNARTVEWRWMGGEVGVKTNVIDGMRFMVVMRSFTQSLWLSILEGRRCTGGHSLQK